MIKRVLEATWLLMFFSHSKGAKGCQKTSLLVQAPGKKCRVGKSVRICIQVPGDSATVTKLYPQTLEVTYITYPLSSGHVNSPSQKGHKDLPGNTRYICYVPSQSNFHHESPWELKAMYPRDLTLGTRGLKLPVKHADWCKHQHLRLAVCRPLGVSLVNPSSLVLQRYRFNLRKLGRPVGTAQIFVKEHCGTHRTCHRFGATAHDLSFS